MDQKIINTIFKDTMLKIVKPLQSRVSFFHYFQNSETGEGYIVCLLTDNSGNINHFSINHKNIDFKPLMRSLKLENILK